MRSLKKNRKEGAPLDDAERELRLDDLRLAQKAKQEREAARRLLDRLVPTVRHTVHMLVDSDSETQDMVHLCLVKILENIDRYRAAGSLEAWARGLAFKVVLRQVKRKRRYERLLLLTPLEKGRDASDPEQEAGRQRVMQRIEHHLRSMPLKRRATLILRLVYGHSVAEVAEITGVPINTARDRIRVGLRELRKSLAADPVVGEHISGEIDGKRK